MASPVFSKQALRDTAFASRNAIPTEERIKASEAVRDNFIKSVYLPSGAFIAGYMPVRAEISVLPLLDALIARGYPILMPRVLPDDTQLEFRTWNRKTPMLRNLYGIEEPDPLQSEPRMPDFFIVPLLAFDQAGNRLGYGAGYYDQTFSRLRGKVQFTAIGIAYETQRYDHVPHEGHDHRLDMCITEKNVYTFRSKI